jgi:hypothetical protein
MENGGAVRDEDLRSASRGTSSIDSRVAGQHKYQQEF